MTVEMASMAITCHDGIVITAQFGIVGFAGLRVYHIAKYDVLIIISKCNMSQKPESVLPRTFYALVMP